ncbi:MAG: hypothetical protein ACE14S_12020 [Candidatus Bathyarchaeia archaeon]
MRTGNDLPTGVTVQIQIKSPNSSWKTLYETVTKNGGYYFEGYISEAGKYSVRASIAADPSLTSTELALTIGEEYIPASNTRIADYPTFDDEYKFSFATILSSDGTVVKRPPFTATNTWLFFASGQTADRQHNLALIGGFRAGPEEGDQGYIRLVLDEGAEQVISLNGPIYFTNHPPSPVPDLPTLHNSLTSDTVCFQSYDEQKATYYITIATGNGSILQAKVVARGTPFWIARKLENLLWMDYLPNPSGTEYWGGFVVVGDMTANLKVSGGPEVTFVGACSMDREWHGTVDNSPYLHPQTDLSQSYTAGPYLVDQEFSMATWKAYDPYSKQVFSQSGIVHIKSLNETFRLDNFTITDDAPNGLYPTKYSLNGQFGVSGRIDLKAQVIRFMFEFGDENNEVFHRPIVLWNGAVTLPDGTSMPVLNAPGIGEEYRIQISSSEDRAPPTIGSLSQTPSSTNVGPHQSVDVTAVVTDDVSGVREVLLSYSGDSGATWTNVTMSLVSGSIYSGQIPGFEAGTGVLYEISAQDKAGNLAIADKNGEYYVYTVIPEFQLIAAIAVMAATAVIVLFAKKVFERFQRRQVSHDVVRLKRAERVVISLWKGLLRFNWLLSLIDQGILENLALR